MNIIVTGGAGYIGSILVEELVKGENQVFVLDNLAQGHREAVESSAKFVCADLCDIEKLTEIFCNQPIEAVIHLAALSTVAQSVTEPEIYFRNNVVYSMNLLDVMLKYGVNKIIFSSSAAVYGSPDTIPITETQPERPVNPYGESKLMFEKILEWYAQAYGLKFCSLRYFNAAGASDNYGEDHNPETHLIPNVLKVALGLTPCVHMYGSNYPTKDGTCIRDYVHVSDIAKAHILALKHLLAGRTGGIYNLGSGEGYSVAEVIEVAKEVTGAEITTVISPPRKGDPPILVADPSLAKRELSWNPRDSTLEDIVKTAWQWQKKYPHGYSTVKGDASGHSKPAI
jgi:UDP-glucose 4-epimerase